MVFTVNREFNCEDWLAQTCAGLADAVPAVNSVRETVAVILLMQPVVVFIPVTVYVVVADAAADTMAPDVALNPMDGLHAYVLAPLAVMEMLAGKPLQIEPPGGVTESTGSGFTRMVTGALEEETPQ